MEKYSINRTVELTNYPLADQTLVDVKFYLREWRWPDGDFNEYEFYDYDTVTVAFRDKEEIIVGDNLDQVLYTILKNMAIDLLNSIDQKDINKDLGGYFE